VKITRKLGIGFMALTLTASGWGKKPAKEKNTLADYLDSLPKTAIAPAMPLSAGSLWIPGGAMLDMVSDYKAHKVGDLITLSVVEQSTAQASDAVAGQRTFSASSAITGLAGQVNTANLNPLLSLNSASQLAGKGQTQSANTLTTSLSGLVVGTFGDLLVVEARHDVFVDNQRQTMLVRGLVRRGDVGPNNTVLSTQVSNLSLELVGKGVISDSVRPPNWIVRQILKLVGF
jgi:flagellar L-ring protein FlgH